MINNKFQITNNKFQYKVYAYWGYPSKFAESWWSASCKILYFNKLGKTMDYGLTTMDFFISLYLHQMLRGNLRLFVRMNRLKSHLLRGGHTKAKGTSFVVLR